MDDRGLLKLMHKDLNAGMTELLNKYTGFVYAVVSVRLSGACDSSEIEDCVAETFVKFAASLDSYRPEKSGIRTYLGVIARNNALNCLRDRAAVLSVDDDFFLELPDGKNLEDEAERRLLVAEVMAEIKKLGPPDSEIIFRRYYLGQSSKDVAAELGLTAANVDTRAHRAMEKLRKIFRGDEK